MKNVFAFFNSVVIETQRIRAIPNIKVRTSNKEALILFNAPRRVSRELTRGENTRDRERKNRQSRHNSLNLPNSGRKTKAKGTKSGRPL